MLYKESVGEWLSMLEQYMQKHQCFAHSPTPFSYKIAKNIDK